MAYLKGQKYDVSKVIARNSEFNGTPDIITCSINSSNLWSEDIIWRGRESIDGQGWLIDVSDLDDIVLLEDEVIQSSAPPIGIIPEILWKEARMWKLIDAISRYRLAQMDIPEKWMFELADLMELIYDIRERE